MKRSFMTAEIFNIVSYFSKMPNEKMTALPTKMRWYIRKNLTRFAPIAKDFEEFRNDIIKDIQTEYFGEEKSEEIMQDVVGQDGQPVRDGEGNIVTERARKVKDEFLDEYRKKLEEVNAKLNEIAVEKQEIEIDEIDLDGFVETMPEDSIITYDDLDMLSAFTKGA